MNRRMLGVLGMLVLLLASRAVAATVTYGNSEDKSDPVVVDEATVLEFPGVAATQSGDISGAGALTITGAGGRLALTGDNAGYTGWVTHESGTLVFAEGKNLFGRMNSYTFAGDATATGNAAITSAISGYAANPTTANWEAIQDAVDTARTAGTLPAFEVAKDSAVVIDGGGGNTQRLVMADGKAGSFHLADGATLTFSNHAASGSGSAVSVRTGALLVLTAGDGAGYAFTGNSADNRGGAIYNDGDIAFSNAVFTGNIVSHESDAGYAGVYGGAILNDSTGTLSASGAIFAGNRAEGSGTDGVTVQGGALVNSGSATLTDAVFAGNSASNESADPNATGGAITNNGTLILKTSDGRSSLFSGNLDMDSGMAQANSIHVMQNSPTSTTIDVGAGGVMDMRDPMSGYTTGMTPSSATVAKTGAGVWKLGGASVFVTSGHEYQFSVNEGTLHLYRADEVDNANGANVAGGGGSGATAGVDAGSISMGGNDSSFTLASGAVLSVGGGNGIYITSNSNDPANAASVARGTITLAANSKLAFDLGAATVGTEMLTLKAAAIEVGDAGADTIGVDLLSLNEKAGTYALVSKNGGDSFVGEIAATPTLRGEAIAGTRAAAAFTNVATALAVAADTISITQDRDLVNEVVTWTGANGGDWNITATNWDGTGNQFLHGDVVNFAKGVPGATQSIAVNAGGVRAAGMFVSGAGNYTFTGGEIVLDGTAGTSFENAGGATGWLMLGAVATGDSPKAGVTYPSFSGVVDLTGTAQNTFKSGINLFSGALRVADAGQLGTGMKNVNFNGAPSDALPDEAEAMKTAVTDYAADPTETNKARLDVAIATYTASISDAEVHTPTIIAAGDLVFAGGAGSQRLDVNPDLSGALHAEDGATIGFYGNATSSRGGAMNINGFFVMTAAADAGGGGGAFAFIGNSTEEYGGAIRNNGTLVLTKATFTGNSAATYGGAIDNTRSLVLTNATFTGNSAATYGGAIDNGTNASSLALTNATFTGNSAGTDGGAIYSQGSLALTNATFTGNSAGTFGGAIFNSGSLALTNATFTGNSAKGSGGAIYAYIGSTTTLKADAGESTLFTGNRDAGGANAIYFYEDAGFASTLNADIAGTLDMRDPMRGAIDTDTSVIAIAKAGAGVWKLGGASDFATNGAADVKTTTFDVNAGTLHLYRSGAVDNASETGNGGKVVAGSIALSDNGGAFSLASGATLEAGGDNAISAEEIAFTSGSTLGFDIAEYGAATGLTLTSAGLDIDDGSDFNFGVNLMSLAEGKYALLTADGYDMPDIDPFATAFTIQNVTYTPDGDFRFRTSLYTEGDTLYVDTEYTDANDNLTWTGSTDGKWDVVTANWMRDAGGNAVRFLSGDAVTFTAAGANKDVAVAGSTKVAGMKITGGAYTFSGESISSIDPADIVGDRVTPSEKLEISGGASATFQNAIAFNKGIEVGLNSTLGFDYAANNDQTQRSIISGDGDLVKKGAGVLTLAADNSYTGATKVEAGTLKATSLSGTGATSGVTVDSGATLELAIAAAGSGNYDKAISGDGGLTKSGDGVVTLATANAYTGGTDITGGGLKLTKLSATGDNSASRAVTVADGTAIELAITAADSGNYNKAISGDGGLTKSGDGVVTLTAANSYAGTTAVDAGVLNVSGSVAGAVAVADGATLTGVGSIGAAGKAVTVAGGGELLAGGMSANGSSRVAGVTSILGNLAMDSGSSMSLTKAGPDNPSPQNSYVAVAGDVALDGSLNATLSHGGVFTVLTYGGDLTGGFAGGGIISGSPDFRVKSTAVDYGSGSNGSVRLVVLAEGQNIQYWKGENAASGGGAGVWNADNRNWTAPVAGASSDYNTSAPWNGSGTIGVFDVAGGAVTVAGAREFDTLQFLVDGYSLSGGELAIAPATGTTGVIYVEKSTDTAVVDSVISGTGGLSKTGLGVLTLGGVNTYAGTTAVDGGILRLSGSVAGDVAVASNASLQGWGRAYGNVTVASGGELNPWGMTADSDGAGGETFTLGGLTMASGSILAVSSAGGLIKVENAADFGDAIILRLGSGFTKTGTTTILNAASISGWPGDGYSGSTAFYNYLVTSAEGGDSRWNLDIEIQMLRTLADAARTRNQRAVANRLGDWTSYYAYLLGLSNDAEAQYGLDLASGEPHVDLLARLSAYGRTFWNFRRGALKQARAIQTASVSANASLVGPGAYLDSRPLLWFEGGHHYSRSSSDSETARAKLSGPEFAVGFETGLGSSWLAGAAFRYGDHDFKVNARNAKFEVDSYEAGLYLARALAMGPVAPRLTFGARGGYHDVDSRRSVFGQRLTSDYDAWSLSGYGELAAELALSECLSIEPYLNLDWTSLWNETIREGGGDLALRGKRGHQGNFSTLVGFRLAARANRWLGFDADLGWRHTYGPVRPESAMTFRADPTRNSFTVIGSRLARDEAAVAAGVTFDFTDRVNLRLGYDGAFGKKSLSHAFNAMVGVGF